jgi:hypothetical protein
MIYRFDSVSVSVSVSLLFLLVNIKRKGKESDERKKGSERGGVKLIN